jgi:hypothetical protein
MRLTASRFASAVCAALACTSCRGSSEPELTIPEIERRLVSSKAAIAALAVAISPQGHSFFDNFLSCPRRGVIDYHNIPGGRRATFTGCDLGDGVVIDGAADVRWTRTSEDPATTRSVSIAGDLLARVETMPPFAVGAVDAAGFAFSAGPPTDGIALLDRLLTSQVQVTQLGFIFPLDARAVPSNVFHPALTAVWLPNPGNGVSKLEDRDLKRIAFHPMIVLASILFDETLEIQRGQHTHTTPCGTVLVTPDLTRNLPKLAFDWSDCDVGLGAFIGGRFTAEWSDFDARTGHLRMVVTGVINVGGGMPRMQFTEIDWEIGAITTLPVTAPIDLRVTTPNGERRLQTFVQVDD